MGEFSLSRAGTSFTFGDRGVGLDGAGDEGEGSADGGAANMHVRAPEIRSHLVLAVVED